MTECIFKALALFIDCSQPSEVLKSERTGNYEDARTMEIIVFCY